MKELKSACCSAPMKVGFRDDNMTQNILICCECDHEAEPPTCSAPPAKSEPCDPDVDLARQLTDNFCDFIYRGMENEHRHEVDAHIYCKLVSVLWKQRSQPASLQELNGKLVEALEQEKAIACSRLNCGGPVDALWGDVYNVARQALKELEKGER